MPGGKVVTYTGLLPITQNEAALAVVTGHEITHAIAHHGNERMSQVAVAQGLAVAGDVFTQNNQKANAIFNNVFGPGAAVGVLLPNSRKQEYEADHFGLNLRPWRDITRKLWPSGNEWPRRLPEKASEFWLHTHLMKEDRKDKQLYG